MAEFAEIAAGLAGIAFRYLLIILILRLLFKKINKRNDIPYGFTIVSGALLYITTPLWAIAWNAGMEAIGGGLAVALYCVRDYSRSLPDHDHHDGETAVSISDSPQHLEGPPQSPPSCSRGDTHNSQQHPDDTSISTHKSSIIVKHWRGDCSLVFSFWIIGVSVSFCAIALLHMTSSIFNIRPLSPQFAGALVLGWYFIYTPVAIWQLTGIWRSAGKHKVGGGNEAWAILSKLIVVLSIAVATLYISSQQLPLIKESYNLLVGIDTTPPYELRILNSGQELELSGGMPFGTTSAVTRLLDSTPTIQIIHLNSTGGRLNEAYMLYNLIAERGLATYTSCECISACTIAFLAGKERYLSDSGRLGFHRGTVGGSEGDFASELDNMVRTTLLQHGASVDFIDRALSTPADQVWYPSNDELIDANVITATVDARYFGFSGVSQWREAHKLEEEILDSPLFSALSKHDPANYDRVRDVLIEGIQEGRAMINIQNDIRSILITDLLPIYLVNAPDNAIVNYMHTQLNEIAYLANINPKSCAYLVFPQLADSLPDLQRILPADMQSDDIDALAEVIVGALTNPHSCSYTTQVESDLESVITNLNHRDPMLLEIIAYPSLYLNDPSSLCTAAHTMYSEILDLPSSSRQGALLRYMFSE